MLNLFFPKLCIGCSEELTSNENEICVQCRHNLPLTNFHLTDNEAMKIIFNGRVPLEQATSLFYFRKDGLTQKFIHALKYKGVKSLGVLFGKWLGEELRACKNYSTLQVVIPVPLHPLKLKKRGYNQVADFGREIANALKIEYYDDVLIKKTPTGSQVFKERFSRMFQQSEVFSVQNVDKINHKRVLLVDDILTTGATFESCANQLLKADGVKLSLATIAITK